MSRSGGGVPVQEGSRKGLGRVQEGGFLCRKGGGSCAGRGFLGDSCDGSCVGKGRACTGKGLLGGSSDGSRAGRGGVPEWHAHAIARTLCPVRGLKRPSPCIATTADPWQPVVTIYLAHCIVNPSNQWPSDSKGTECQPAGMRIERPALVPPWCCERSPRPPSTSSGSRVSARVVPSPSGTLKHHFSPRYPGRMLRSGRSSPPKCSQAA